MTVAGIQHTYASGEVDVTPPFDIPYLRILGTLGVDVVHICYAACHGALTPGQEI
jgi:hypothetical protein